MNDSTYNNQIVHPNMFQIDVSLQKQRFKYISMNVGAKINKGGEKKDPDSPRATKRRLQETLETSEISREVDRWYFLIIIMKFAGVATFMTENFAGRASETRELNERIVELVVKLGQKPTITLYNCYTSQSGLGTEPYPKSLSTLERSIKKKAVSRKELDMNNKLGYSNSINALENLMANLLRNYRLPIINYIIVTAKRGSQSTESTS
eukprot:snap_masked-scaffold_86-processed-gene-0.16-mRNA-1 protein AED:1.00 eAED:1.00 QI:0/0/0/0/1/1/3/0/207